MLRLRTLYSRAALTLALALPLPWLASMDAAPAAARAPSSLALQADLLPGEPVAVSAVPAVAPDRQREARRAELLQTLRERVLAERVAVLDADERQRLAWLDAFFFLRESGLGALPRVRSQASRLRSLN